MVELKGMEIVPIILPAVRCACGAPALGGSPTCPGCVPAGVPLPVRGYRTPAAPSLAVLDGSEEPEE